MSKLRASTGADGQRVVRIWSDAVDATHHFLSAADRVAIDQEVAAFLPDLPLMLAVDEADRAVGFMALAEGHIEALFVDPVFHGRGVGRALVEHATETHGALTVDVNEQNEGASGFYRRLEFSVVGRSPLDGQGRPYPLIHLRRPITP